MGGIVEAYIANFEDVASATVSDNQITAITMAESAKFKKYYFKRNSGQFTSTLNVTPENGVNYVSTEIVLLFSRMDTVKRIDRPVRQCPMATGTVSPFRTTVSLGHTKFS